MTLASGLVVYGSSGGSLRSATFADAAITGAASVLSSDGTWNYGSIFVPND